MRIYRTITMAALVLALTTPVTHADQYELTGTLRDFSSTHVDFQNSYNWQFPLIRGMVKDDLGPNDKPVLNIMPDGCYSVYITSIKDLSNVVLRMIQLNEAGENITSGHKKYVDFKYDNLDVNPHPDGIFELPGSNPSSDGWVIDACFVKAGNNSSSEGAGYGELFELDEDICEVDLEDNYVMSNAVYNEDGSVDTRATITVTFYATASIPAQWRVDSIESFDQWYNNNMGVNESVPCTIVLDNGQIAPGGTYRYEASIHNNMMFFPGDGRLKGNEGNAHNYHFTYEIATKFVYTDPATRDDSLFLHFAGDDDVWLFINGKLVIDLGGVHGESADRINIDALASDLGLTAGGMYDFNFFFAERHTTHSNLTLETNLPFLASQYD